jgi:hypothetical protein
MDGCAMKSATISRCIPACVSHARLAPAPLPEVAAAFPTPAAPFFFPFPSAADAAPAAAAPDPSALNTVSASSAVVCSASGKGRCAVGEVAELWLKRRSLSTVTPSRRFRGTGTLRVEEWWVGGWEVRWEGAYAREGKGVLGERDGR